MARKKNDGAGTGEIMRRTSKNAELTAFKRLLDLQGQKRILLENYIIKHLKQGVDFGRIEGTTKSGKTFKSEKPSLFKAGAEKVLNRTNVQAVLKKDVDTWEMTGNKPGVVCYICELFMQDGIKIGEGRGAADIREIRFGGSFNNCIKIAEKRARVDAVLSTYALSDRFTQDLNDEDERQVSKAGKLSSQNSTGGNNRAKVGDLGRQRANAQKEANTGAKRQIFRIGGNDMTRAQFEEHLRKLAADVNFEIKEAVQTIFGKNRMEDLSGNQMLALFNTIQNRIRKQAAERENNL